MFKFDIDGDPNWTWDTLDQHFSTNKEMYVMSANLLETVQNVKLKLVVTTKGYYKFLQDSIAIRKRKDLLDIHSCYQDPQDDKAFLMFSYKAKEKLTKSKLSGALGMGMQFETFLQTRRFVCESSLECAQFVLVLNKLLRDLWQETFEEEWKIVPDPEIYQFHALVIKSNRKGMESERLLVLSTDWVYNIEVEHNPTRLKEKKWALPIANLTAVKVERQKSANGGDFTATLQFDVPKDIDAAHRGSKRGSPNPIQEMSFQNEQLMDDLVHELQRLYFYRKGLKEQLNVIEVNDSLYEEKAAKEVQNRESNEVVLKADLLKFTNDGKNSHKKQVVLFPSGMIEWYTDNKSKPLRERITSVVSGGSLKNKALTADEEARFFTVYTTGKMLQFLGSTVEEKDLWVNTIKKFLDGQDHI